MAVSMSMRGYFTCPVSKSPIVARETESLFPSSAWVSFFFSRASRTT